MMMMMVMEEQREAEGSRGKQREAEGSKGKQREAEGSRGDEPWRRDFIQKNSFVLPTAVSALIRVRSVLHINHHSTADSKKAAC